jgi:hypothetical protein
LTYDEKVDSFVDKIIKLFYNEHKESFLILLNNSKILGNMMIEDKIIKLLINDSSVQRLIL